MTSKKIFYILTISGIAFITIGGISIVDSNIPRKVSLAGTLDTNRTDVITPIMNKGSIGKIIIDGSRFNFKVEDPGGSIITTATNQSHYEYDLIAQNDGQYRLETRNIGDSVVKIEGDVETKAGPLALGGQMMLLITGIIVLGIAMKAKFA